MNTTDEAGVDAEVERRMQMPYAKELVRDENGSYFAHVVELPGCMTVGATEVDALNMLDDAMRSWLEVGIEAGDAIPEPARSEAFSGKFNVRVAKSLHRDLARRAEREGVSLNTWIATTLAASVAGNVSTRKGLTEAERDSDFSEVGLRKKNRERKASRATMSKAGLL